MKSEFSADVMKLNHHAPEHFTQFAWEQDIRPTLKYVVFDRCLNYFFIAFAVTTLVILLTKYEKYYLFFDFWSGILIDIALLPPLGHFKKSYGDPDSWDTLHWIIRINWVFYSAAIPAAVVGVVSYWILLYQSYPYTFLIVFNTVPPALILVTTLITSIPMRVLYAIFFIGFYLTYIFFTAAYQLTGRKGPKDTDYIYKALNWKDSNRALLTTFLGLLIGVGVYFVFCVISIAKTAIKEKHAD